jgi:hypothetical protein
MGLIEALQESQVTRWNPAEVIRWNMDKKYLRDFGGTSQFLSPPPELIKRAEAILRLVDQPLLYARVDGVDIDGKFTLIELELIESHLFLQLDPAAPERFAEAIAAFL